MVDHPPPWDGVERRVQDRELWSALDLYDAQIDRLRTRQALTDEEVFMMHQHCSECRPRRSGALSAVLWALLVASLGALCICLAYLWHK